MWRRLLGPAGQQRYWARNLLSGLGPGRTGEPPVPREISPNVSSQRKPSQGCASQVWYYFLELQGTSDELRANQGRYKQRLYNGLRGGVRLKAGLKRACQKPGASSCREPISDAYFRNLLP